MHCKPDAFNLGTQRSREKQPCFSCSWRDGVNKEMDFCIFRFVSCFYEEQVWLWVYRFSGFFDPHTKKRYLLLRERCGEITFYLLRTDNFRIALGSEVAYESPWLITLQFFKEMRF